MTVGHYHRGYHATGSLGCSRRWRRCSASPGGRRRRATGFRHRGVDGERAAAQPRDDDEAAHTGIAARSALPHGISRRAVSRRRPTSSKRKPVSTRRSASRNRAPDLTADRLGKPFVIVDPGPRRSEIPVLLLLAPREDGTPHAAREARLDAQSIDKVICRMQTAGGCRY